MSEQVLALSDGNSFYCSCERVFDPKLEGRPVIVLSNNDGCAIARTPEAKALGIRMGDPWHKVRARYTAAGGVARSSNYALYGDISRRVNAVYNRFSAEVEVYSIDESFLDLSHAPDPAATAGDMRRMVRQWTGIPTCVGLGPTKTLAKLANWAAKHHPELEGVCDFTRPAVREAAMAAIPVGEGADVAIVYLPSEEADAKEVLALIEAEGRTAVALPGDITDEGFCVQLVKEAVEKLGGLDILVNNAGKQQTQPSIADVTTEQFDQTLKTNLYAMFWITKAARDHLPPGSAIINTASVVAYKAPEALLDYSTTKAGIVAFTKALAKQLIERGVRANVVAPGPFWTALQPSGGQTQEDVQTFGEGSLFGRPGQPVELAPIFVLLASQDGSYITGEVYGATGGSGAIG